MSPIRVTTSTPGDAATELKDSPALPRKSLGLVAGGLSRPRTDEYMEIAVTSHDNYRRSLLKRTREPGSRNA